MEETYFLSQDNSSHWYVVPTSMRDDWEYWCNLPDDDEASWDAPDFARVVGGSPSLVKFSQFTIG